MLDPALLREIDSEAVTHIVVTDTNPQYEHRTLYSDPVRVALHTAVGVLAMHDIIYDDIGLLINHLLRSGYDVEGDMTGSAVTFRRTSQTRLGAEV